MRPNVVGLHGGDRQQIARRRAFEAAEIARQDREARRLARYRDRHRRRWRALALLGWLGFAAYYLTR